MNRSNDELVIDQGPLIATGRKLDIFMKGGTVLGCKRRTVRWRSPRRGDLTIDQAGFLSTANGHVVLGDGGAPITVPVGVELAITDDGTVTATDPVQPDAPPTVVGNLLLRDSTGIRMVRRTRRALRNACCLGEGRRFCGRGLTHPRYRQDHWKALPSTWLSSLLVLWICLDRSRSRSK